MADPRISVADLDSLIDKAKAALDALLAGGAVSRFVLMGKDITMYSPTQLIRTITELEAMRQDRMNEGYFLSKLSR